MKAHTSPDTAWRGHAGIRAGGLAHGFAGSQQRRWRRSVCVCCGGASRVYRWPGLPQRRPHARHQQGRRVPGGPCARWAIARQLPRRAGLGRWVCPQQPGLALHVPIVHRLDGAQVYFGAFPLQRRIWMQPAGERTDDCVGSRWACSAQRAAGPSRSCICGFNRSPGQEGRGRRAHGWACGGQQWVSGMLRRDSRAGCGAEPARSSSVETRASCEVVRTRADRW